MSYYERQEPMSDAEADALLRELMEEDALLTSPGRTRMLTAAETGKQAMVLLQSGVDAFGGTVQLSFRTESVVGDQRVRLCMERGSLDLDGNFVRGGTEISFMMPVAVWEYLRHFTVSPSGEFEIERPWMASFTALQQAWERAFPYLRERPANNDVTARSESSRKNTGNRLY